MLLESTIAGISELNGEAMKKAQLRLDSFIKPPGSLGIIEDIAVQMAGIQGKVIPEYGKVSVILMAGDHGVVAEGVSVAPQEITAQMLSAFAAGVAGINIISRSVGAHLLVVDIGVAGNIDIPGVLDYKIKHGADNIVHGPAMSRSEAIRAVEAGITIANTQIDKGYDILATGEMGIGNTTPSSAILSVMTGIKADVVTGRGTMVNNLVLDKKIWAVKEAIRINQPNPKDGIDVVSKVGGLEIAGLAGVILGSAARRIPVVIDGFISTAAAMIACTIEPMVKSYILPSHLSGEQGHSLMLKHLGLRPLLHLDMRLGEGTGAALVMGIIKASCEIMAEMASFDEAGLSQLDGDKLHR